MTARLIASSVKCGLFALLIGLAAPAAAQRIEFAGRGEDPTDETLKRFLEANAFTAITRDTLIARDDTLDGPVLIAGTTARIEGVIAGDLLIVDANVFLRPTARVLGDVTNVAGGYYPSERATVIGEVVNQPNASYDVERLADGIRIVGTRRPSMLELDGLRGFHLPEYDRVNALTLGFGAGYYLPRPGALEPFVHGVVRYHSERGVWDGGGEFRLIREPSFVFLGAERATFTNDAWIRGAALNSLSFLVRENDYRNYYDADRIYVGVARAFGSLTSTFTARLTGRIENARSLRADDPWTLFSQDSIRPNPAIDDGRITSGILGLNAAFDRPDVVAELNGDIEVGGKTLDGDFSFAMFAFYGTTAVPAIANHTLAVKWMFQGPLPGTDSLPRQRWRLLGGSGTLPTFDIGEFFGDRVVFTRTEYSIPAPPRLRIPVLGIPSLDLLYSVGKAWPEGGDSDLEQNIGLRLRFPLVYARVVTDPSDAGDIEFAIGVGTPRSYPWQRAGR